MLESGSLVSGSGSTTVSFAFELEQYKYRCRSRVRGAMGSDGPPGVAERVKQWAEKKRRAAAHAYEQARDGARDVWASKDAAEAALKARLLLRRVDWNAVCAHVGRVFVALYFVNMCVENTEAYGAHRERYGAAPRPPAALPGEREREGRA